MFVILVAHGAGDFQVNFNIGQDDPSSSDTRTEAANLVKFGLQNGDGIFRFGSAFTIVKAGGNLTQGDFGIGPYIYPLASVTKSFFQPFFWVEGSFGFGSYADVIRIDAGYGMGAGVDIKMTKKWGFTLAIAQQNATESATRLWVGIFFN